MENKMSKINYAETYKTNFDSLIFDLGNVPGSNMYTSQDTADVAFKQYEEKYSTKTIKRLVKYNENNWAIKGYKISFSPDLVEKYFQ